MCVDQTIEFVSTRAIEVAKGECVSRTIKMVSIIATEGARGL